MTINFYRAGRNLRIAQNAARSSPIMDHCSKRKSNEARTATHTLSNRNKFCQLRDYVSKVNRSQHPNAFL